VTEFAFHGLISPPQDCDKNTKEKYMPPTSPYKKCAMRVVLLAGASLLLPIPAMAQGLVYQTLDNVVTYSSSTVKFLSSTNPPAPITGRNGLKTCTMAAAGGLYCAEGNAVRNAPGPVDFSFPAAPLFNCSAFGIIGGNKSDACTGLAVTSGADFWLAAKKGNSHIMIKVVKKGSLSCPSGWSESTGYCAKEMYSGRPPLADITMIDGEQAALFAKGKGVLAVEEKQNAVFFPDLGNVAGTVSILATSTDWALNKREGETLQGVSLFQLAGATPVNYVIAVTSSGRIKAKKIGSPDLAALLYTVPVGTANCVDNDQRYGVSVSKSTKLVYVSVCAANQVLVLQQAVTESLTGLTLTATLAGPSSPIGVTVGPGLPIRISDCVVGCTVVPGSSANKPAAAFYSVNVLDTANSGALVFQIKNIPDCRYLGSDPACVGVVDNPLVPVAGQRLNVTPLLPSEVKAAFLSTYGYGLPDLLISPQYRARATRGYLFDAFFVVSQVGVRFVDTFESEYDVPFLEDKTTSLTGYRCIPPANSTLSDLLAWDISTRASERYIGVGGKWVDTLTNIGCGSIRGGNSGFSLLPYDLEITTDTYYAAIGATPTAERVLTTGNDAVFARLLQGLVDELEYVSGTLACTSIDQNPLDDSNLPQPQALPVTVCSSLAATMTKSKTFLNKCINASFQPKSSSGNENCQSFVSQISNFRGSLPTSTPADDVANRTGELKVRVDSILHVFNTRFLPSIPPLGFKEEGIQHP
jgi:hypothetical protein